MTVQYIDTKGGRLAVLPEAEYRRLAEAAEMLDDVAAFDAAARRRAAGEEDYVPAAVVDRLLAGENKVRVWREHRDLKQRELAAAAEIGAAYLSQLESGDKTASVDVYKRLAAALKVDVDDLI